MPGAAQPRPTDCIDASANMRAVLTALAGELRTLAAASAKLETLIVTIADESCGAEHVEGLQDADALSQALDNLAAYVEQLSRDAPADGRLSVGKALGRVRLSDMAARLAGRAAEEERTSPGDLDVF